MVAVYKAGPQVESSLWPMSLLTLPTGFITQVGLCMETERQSQGLRSYEANYRNLTGRKSSFRGELLEGKDWLLFLLHSD